MFKSRKGVCSYVVFLDCMDIITYKEGIVKKKMKKTPVMIFVREFGKGNKTAPEKNVICGMFHKYHLRMGVVWNTLCPAQKDMHHRKREGICPPI